VWLADYMISSSLADAYQARVDAGLPVLPAPPVPAGQPVLTPEVQAQISAEVRRQVALESAEAESAARGVAPDPASSGIERMLTDDTSHVFVVGENMDVTNSFGQECQVTPGDVLQLRAPPAPDATAANLIVLASKGAQECPKSSIVTVALNDLQELQNYMRQTIDRGLGEAQKQVGKALPKPPLAAAAPATDAPYAQGAPPLEPNIATELAQQDLEAETAEQEAKRELGQPANKVTAMWMEYAGCWSPTGAKTCAIL